jgi:quinol monooxygenase YgiN
MGLLDLTGPLSVFWSTTLFMEQQGLHGYARHTVSPDGGPIRTAEGVRIETTPISRFQNAEGSDTMTTVSAKSDVMTLINVFTVEPANQRRLVELLTEATEVSVRRAPGFVSASLHRSTDGTKVTMYAQWRSIDDYQAMRQDPAPLPFLQEALRIAKFEPGVYEVVRTFTPAGEPN